MAAPNQDDQPAAALAADASGSPAAGHDQAATATPGPDPTQLIVDLLAGTTLGLGAPMDAPSRLDQPPPPPAAAAEAGASVPSTDGHDPGNTSSYGDGLTRGLTSPLAKAPFAGLTSPLAKAPFAKPLAAPLDNPLRKFAQPLPAGAPVYPAMTGGHDLGAPPCRDKIGDLLLLNELARGAIASSGRLDKNRASLPMDITCWIRPRQGMPDSDKPAGGHAERAARRRERRRLFKIPMDYPRAGKDSRERRQRRSMVRRCLRRLFFVHKDRANERDLSAMMARMMTLESLASAAGDGGATVSAAAEDAAAPSSTTEHAGLDELFEKMELSFKD